MFSGIKKYICLVFIIDLLYTVMCILHQRYALPYISWMVFFCFYLSYSLYNVFNENYDTKMIMKLLFLMLIQLFSLIGICVLFIAIFFGT